MSNNTYKIEEALKHTRTIANDSYLKRAMNLRYAVKFSEELIGIGRISGRNLYKNKIGRIATLLKINK